MRRIVSCSRRSTAALLALLALTLAPALRLTAADDAGRFSVADARAMVLAPLEGEAALDRSLRAWQARAAAAPVAEAPWEALGRLFITKARLSGDPGFYKLAEQSARVLESVAAAPDEAQLLRGHAWLAMHRFRDAETVARQLTQRREQMRDHALLGDALLDQGRVAEAAVAYQTMVDLKPCLQSYSRIAQLRWITGDREGTIELLREAISCGSYREPEPLAWVTVRLAVLELEGGRFDAVRRCARRALELVPGYPPALVAEARVLLADGNAAAAAPLLERAAALSPLPDTQWLLADALRAAGREPEAAAIEGQLRRHGAAHDPRTFALFLATRAEQPAKAVALATAELTTRADVFTFDALAWAQYAAGDFAAARAHSRRALAEGTGDARLQLHAGLIARAAGDAAESASLLARAQAGQATLFPSERQALQRALTDPTPIAAAPTLPTEKP